MSDKILKMYPSGFLGSAVVALTEPPNLAEISKNLFDRVSMRPNESYTANRDLSKLWEDYLTGAADLNKFSTIEDLVFVAKRSFGTTSLEEWILSQKASEFATQSHVDWVNDTLNVLYADTPRKYMYNVWLQALVPGEQIRVNFRTNEFIKFIESPKTDTSIDKVILLWLQRAGAIDLLTSLYLLFGPR